MKHAFDNVARIGWLLVAGALIWSMTGSWLPATPRQVGQNSATAMTVQSAGPIAPLAPATAPTPSSKAAVAGASAKPEVPYVPAGSGFTYQGSLKDGGNPANGGYDFVFTLYDALTGGNLVGAPITQTNVTVTGGLFTVPLDFGSSAFDGNARYLEIAVRQSGGGSYTTLSPRQPITPAPYALFALKTTPYKNVVTVAQSGGQYTTITAALNSITDASSTNHYLVWVGPGVYAETVTMKQWVDIEGAGEQSTKVTFTGSNSQNTGTVVGASNAELRFLTVENTGGNGTSAIAIYNNSASPSLLHVTATASGGSVNSGVHNDSASPNMTNVTATASGGSGASNNEGVSNFNSSSPNMSNVIATASGGSSINEGVYNYNSSSPNMTNITASASGAATLNYGVGNNTSSSPSMTNVTATASGGNGNYGVYNYGSTPKIVTSNISASGGVNNYGVLNANGTVVTIDNSKITASTHTISIDAASSGEVGASQLAGGNVSNGGTLHCPGVYDENYVFYPSTCP